MTEAMNKVFGPAKVPMIGGISGAMSLRQPPAGNPNNRYMFSQRASYADEAEAIGNQLATLGLKNIAVFYQNDGFGKAGLEGLTTALKKHNLAPSATASVERNSEDISKAVETISKASPQAVVMVTLFKPTAALVKALHKANQSPMFMTLSPVGAEQLTQELGNDARGIGISQVMPYPWNDTVPVVKEYQHFIGKQGPYTYMSMEGFIIAKLAVEAIRKAGGKELSREKLVSTLEGIEPGLRRLSRRLQPQQPCRLAIRSTDRDRRRRQADQISAAQGSLPRGWHRKGQPLLFGPAALRTVSNLSGKPTILSVMPKTISQHKATETMKSLRKAIFASLLALGICQAHAEDGVTDSSITLGMSAPFTGPNGLYGMQMREAMTAYFDQVNKGGGVNGREDRTDHHRRWL